MKKEEQKTLEALATIFIDNLRTEGKLPNDINVDSLRKLLSSDISSLEELQKLISS